MKFHLLYIAFIICMSFQCETETYSPCDDIRNGIMHLDLNLAKPGVDLMLEDLDPSPTGQDPIGHEENLSAFVEKLNVQCSIQSSIDCYGCIETFPVLSHLLITIDSAGVPVSRTLDIVTPADTVMTLRDIHH